MRRLPIALFLFAAAYGFCSPWTSMPTVKVEPASLGGLSSLSVRCDVRGASVWLDHQYRGTVPLDLTGIAPGSHLLVLRADDYYDAAITLSLAADTKTTVTAALQLITGFIDARVDPADAEVIVDGVSFPAGVIEVPAGRRAVTVRAFGYREQSFTVYVPERLFASVTAVLERAPFEASGFSLSRSRFNPRNSGLKGIVRIRFDVTAEGYADVRIIGPDGLEVETGEMGPFDDWEQSYAWNGRAPGGEPLPDGEYTVEVTARPAAGVESGSEAYGFSTATSIDSSLIVATTGAYGAMYGSAYAPEALAPASDGFRIDALGFALLPVGDGTASGGAALSVAAALQAGLDVGAGMEIRGESEPAARLGVRVSAPLPAPFGLAAVAEGRISGGAAGNPAWARFGVALGLGTPFLNVVAMPQIGAYWEDGLSARAGLGAAVALGGYNVGAALSAEALSGPLSNGLAVGWPVRAAMELRFSPAGLPVSLRAVLGLELSPDPTSWSVGLGISGGF